MRKLSNEFPDHGGGTVELARSILRNKEETDPKVNFKALCEEASKLQPPHLDHVTFSGPITVKESAGRERGLFTTRAVKAGELFLCEKAFAHSWVHSEGEKSIKSGRVHVLLNTHTNRMTQGTQNDLLVIILQKLYKNPSLLPKFYKLYHGSYKPIDISKCDGTPVIDT
jgi:hypothetical protein